MSLPLQGSYRLIAPFYDWVLERATFRLRQQSLQRLTPLPASQVLICGAGTGLDFPHLPPHHHYTALDLTPAMLARSRPRREHRQVELVVGDAQSLPFPDHAFDVVVCHLIVAVVPDPERCLQEAARVLKPGGLLLVLDKFLRPGERAWLRRGLNPLSRRIATRLDVVFESVLSSVPTLSVGHDQGVAFNGWFRQIVLHKEST